MRAIGVLLVSMAMAGCSLSTDARNQPISFAIIRTMDSVGVYDSSYPACQFYSPYCWHYVPSTAGAFTGTLTLFQPHAGSAAYDRVWLDDSRIGTSTDSSGVLAISLAPEPDTGSMSAHYLHMTATISGDSIRGRWTEQLDPHGISRTGTFRGLRSRPPL